MSGVLEYLTAEILELAGNITKENRKVRITPRHIMLAIRTDVELNELLSGVNISEGGVMPSINPVLIKKTKQKTSDQNSDVTATDMTNSETF